MSQELATPATAVLPPRPNLGPEPWPETARPMTLWLVVIGVAAIAIAVAAWVGRRRRARKRSSQAELGNEIAIDAGDPTPRSRLIALAETARRLLAARFGAAWLAKTTEEIAERPELVEWLGSEKAAALAELLGDADLAKFAATWDGPQREDWADWLDGFRADAGAISTIKGK